MAEILNANSQLLRLRLGDNANGGTSTVIYEAGIPASMAGLTGVTASPSTTSTNAVAGGSGVYTVRIVTDVNARGSVAPPLQGTFSYDSSVPMSCVTPATCAATTIPFTQISWNLRDNDTHDLVTQYDGGANQLAQLQTDTSAANGQFENRHRNYFEYVFDNANLLPAGTYEGTITLNGNATGSF